MPPDEDSGNGHSGDLKGCARVGEKRRHQEGERPPDAGHESIRLEAQDERGLGKAVIWYLTFLAGAITGFGLCAVLCTAYDVSVDQNKVIRRIASEEVRKALAEHERTKDV